MFVQTMYNACFHSEPFDKEFQRNYSKHDMYIAPHAIIWKNEIINEITNLNK